MEVAGAPTRLKASGVGSCIVVTLYDSMRKTGALAHTLLWDSTAGIRSANPFKYADTAVPEMIDCLERAGSKKWDMEVKLAGAANMFPSLLSAAAIKKEDAMVAAKNRIEQECGVKIVGESLGGTHGRSVELDTATGIVTIKIRI